MSIQVAAEYHEYAIAEYRRLASMRLDLRGEGILTVDLVEQYIVLLEKFLKIELKIIVSSCFRRTKENN